MKILAMLSNAWAKVLRSTTEARCRVCGSVLSALNPDGLCRAESCQSEDQVLRDHNSGL